MTILKKRPRIIVLEDDRASRKLLSVMLEKAGYDVDQCGEGRYAIDIAVKYPPAVMVVDVMLPDMTGIEVVDELNGHRNCRFIRKIFLTGLLSKKTNEIDSKFSFEVGGTHYRALAKPFKKSALLGLIGEAVESYELEQDKIAEEEAAEEAKKQGELPRAKVERTEERVSSKDDVSELDEDVEEFESATS